jgi:hypothetical protein
MGGRGRASFEKRRKEQARKEKRVHKAEKKATRPTGLLSPDSPDSIGSLEEILGVEPEATPLPETETETETETDTRRPA